MPHKDTNTCACSGKGGFSRRNFIKSMGASAVVACVSSRQAAAAQEQQEISPNSMVPVSLRINGLNHKLLVDPRWTLLFVLREKLGLTAAKEGCGRGECGSCTVLIDGRTRYACLTLALEAQGAHIETAEGFMRGEELGDVQQAFLEEDAFQCGYCTPGQVVAAEGLLRENNNPTFEEIRVGMSGNLCRCGAYGHIFNAVENVKKKRG